MKWVYLGYMDNMITNDIVLSIIRDAHYKLFYHIHIITNLFVIISTINNLVFKYVNTVSFFYLNINIHLAYYYEL